MLLTTHTNASSFGNADIFMHFALHPHYKDQGWFIKMLSFVVRMGKSGEFSESRRHSFLCTTNLQAWREEREMAWIDKSIAGAIDHEQIRLLKQLFLA